MNICISRSGAPIEAKGSAILNDPFDPLKPAELIVNFESQPSFSKTFSVLIHFNFRHILVF